MQRTACERPSPEPAKGKPQISDGLHRDLKIHQHCGVANDMPVKNSTVWPVREDSGLLPRGIRSPDVPEDLRGSNLGEVVLDLGADLLELCDGRLKGAGVVHNVIRLPTF